MSRGDNSEKNIKNTSNMVLISIEDSKWYCSWSKITITEAKEIENTKRKSKRQRIQIITCKKEKEEFVWNQN